MHVKIHELTILFVLCNVTTFNFLIVMYVKNTFIFLRSSFCVLGVHFGIILQSRVCKCGIWCCCFNKKEENVLKTP